MSSLIEVFGDIAVESVLVVAENMIFTNADGTSPSKVTVTSATNVQSVEEVNIYEYTYTSTNKKHVEKKKEVALFLIGNFAEDVSMYR